MHVNSFEIRRKRFLQTTCLHILCMHNEAYLIYTTLCTHIISKYLSTRLYFLPNFAHSLEANVNGLTNHPAFTYGIRKPIFEPNKNKIFYVNKNYYTSSQLFLQPTITILAANCFCKISNNLKHKDELEALLKKASSINFCHAQTLLQLFSVINTSIKRQT